MTIGIEQFRTRRDLWLDRMLIQPLRGPASGYAINRADGDGHLSTLKKTMSDRAPAPEVAN